MTLRELSVSLLTFSLWCFAIAAACLSGDLAYIWPLGLEKQVLISHQLLISLNKNCVPTRKGREDLGGV